jgi:hypothetical protein
MNEKKMKSVYKFVITAINNLKFKINFMNRKLNGLDEKISEERQRTKPDYEKEKEIFFLGQSGDEGIFEKINSNLDDRGTL